MEINLVEEALKFMMLGMGVVFTFLTIMIFVLQFQKIIITKFFPQKEAPIHNKPKASSTNSTAKVAAIVAAVQHHKNLKR